MKNFVRLILLAGLIVVAFFGWKFFFPNSRQVIHNHLNSVASLVSFSGNEGNITRVAKIKKLGTLFTEDLRVTVELPGEGSQTFERRDEVLQILMAAKRMGKGLKVEFLDMNIHVNPDDQSADADLTLKAKITGENDVIAQELKFTFKKMDGDWLISRIETIRPMKP